MAVTVQTVISQSLAGIFAASGAAVFPAVGDVRISVEYGPTGADYTGTYQLTAVAVDIGNVPEIEEAIYRLLTIDATTGVLAGTRIYPLRAPQENSDGTPIDLPYITFQRISADHEHHMDSASGLVVTRLQIDGYAGSYTMARALSHAIREALDGYRGSVTVEDGAVTIKMMHLENDLDGIDESTGEDLGSYRITQDYRIGTAESVPTF